MEEGEGRAAPQRYHPIHMRESPRAHGATVEPTPPWPMYGSTLYWAHPSAPRAGAKAQARPLHRRPRCRCRRQAFAAPSRSAL